MSTSMHGECKTPGGKLIAVDFSVSDNCLREVKVHGDFFLEPDDSFEAITKSLEGASIDDSDEELATKISKAIPAGTEWLGASPEALVTAVRRGLTAAKEAGGGSRGWS
jgi:lipoate---protein ligase